MLTPQQCWFVCNNKTFQTAKWLLSALSVALTSTFVIMLEVS
jgi:hypothetical protein